jgi:hypothetical protein
MSTRDKHARKRARQSARAKESSSESRWRLHKRPWDVLVDLLGSTKNAIIAVGALAGAVVAIVTVVNMILPKGPSPKPTVEASFPEAKVDQNIVLAQYEYNNQPASSTNASDLGQPRIRYRLVADASTAASTTGEPGNGTQTTSTETVKETPEEAEAKLKKEKEEKAALEKATEEAERKQEALKAKEAAKKAKEEAEAKEEAKLRAKEEVALRREEEAEGKTVPPIHGKQVQGKDGGEHQGGSETRTSVEPAAPAQSFHREGAAKVAIGTGAPTKEVDAVLRKARAILRHRRAARPSQAYGRSGAFFEGNSSAFRDISASNLPLSTNHALVTAASDAEGATLANSVPSHCGPSCALAPTVDKALADYSSNLSQAARVVASAFSESRIELYEAKPQPVGVTVDYTIHFVGYEGQLMKLEWTLDKSGRPLPKTWWRKVVVKQIVPSSESIGVSGNFWAPVPPQRGDYYFSLRVLDGSAEPTHRASEQFH